MEAGVIMVHYFIDCLTKADPRFNYSYYCKKFVNYKTNRARMGFVYHDMKRYKAFPVFRPDKKSDYNSIQAREEGNKCYTKREYRQALDHYTSSILRAESEENLALGYSHRSAALMQLNLYNECLNDIDRALMIDKCPTDIKPKLLARQQSVMTEIGIKTNYHQPVPEIAEAEKHPRIQCAKNCVKSLNTMNYGRHILATRDIEVGEIITVEPAYCAIVENEVFIHCHECLELCYDLIPCDKCTTALYCGTACKDKAFERYHKYECPIFYTLDYLRVDFPKRLAMRIIFTSRNQLDERKLVDFEKDEYRSDRFQEVSCLASNNPKRKADNLLGRTIAACTIFYLIKHHTNFLRDYSNEGRLQEMLLTVMLKCGVNSVNIHELRPMKNRQVAFYDLSAIATAVYPFFSMFNHSCCPNVARHFYGTTMVLRAYNTIKKGEQCFVCYGPRYPIFTHEERRKFLLENRFFSCGCEACKFNLPVEKDLNEWQMDTMYRLRMVDVEVAKNELEQIVEEVKKVDGLPIYQSFVARDVLSFCYNIFGNKRRI